MSSVQISCCLDSTDYSAGLIMQVWLDNQQIFNDIVLRPTELKFDIDDDSASHCLRFEMQNKTPDHTKISESGEIVSDARLIVKDLTFDIVELGHLFVKKAVYTHDFNGTGATVNESFYGEMGCNGTVTLRFETPVYLWLLENL